MTSKGGCGHRGAELWRQVNLITSCARFSTGAAEKISGSDNVWLDAMIVGISLGGEIRLTWYQTSLTAGFTTGQFFLSTNVSLLSSEPSCLAIVHCFGSEPKTQNVSFHCFNTPQEISGSMEGWYGFWEVLTTVLDLEFKVAPTDRTRKTQTMKRIIRNWMIILLPFLAVPGASTPRTPFEPSFPAYSAMSSCNRIQYRDLSLPGRAKARPYYTKSIDQHLRWLTGIYCEHLIQTSYCCG